MRPHPYYAKEGQTRCNCSGRQQGHSLQSLFATQIWRHINIEYVFGQKACKYIFKYLLKGIIIIIK